MMANYDFDTLFRTLVIVIKMKLRLAYLTFMKSQEKKKKK